MIYRGACLENLIMGYSELDVAVAALSSSYMEID